MVARRLYVPEAQPSRDPNGRALPARLKFFEPGTSRDELKIVYAESGLTTPLSQPIESDSTGQFPAIWADSAESFDVVWYERATGRQLGVFAGITPLSDAVAASVGLADAAAAGAEAAQGLAEDAQAAAEVARDQAQAIAAQVGDLGAAVTDAQAAAAAAAASAQAAAVFDPTHYVTSIAGYGGSVTAAQLNTALGLDKLKRRRLLLNLDFG